jgi:hypothetical protein
MVNKVARPPMPPGAGVACAAGAFAGADPVGAGVDSVDEVVFEATGGEFLFNTNCTAKNPTASSNESPPARAQ